MGEPLRAVVSAAVVSCVAFAPAQAPAAEAATAVLADSAAGFAPRDSVTAPRGASRSGPVPSAAAIAALRDTLAQEHGVRLLGTFGARDIERPTLDSTGVGSAKRTSWAARPGAVLTTPDAPPAVPRPVPWSQISEMQVGHDHAGRGALIGALAGTFLGAAAALAIIDNADPNGYATLAAVGVIPGGAVVGALLGFVIGSSHGHWRTVYRAGEGGP